MVSLRKVPVNLYSNLSIECLAESRCLVYLQQNKDFCIQQKKRRFFCRFKITFHNICLVAAASISLVLSFSASVGQVQALTTWWAVYFQTTRVLRAREPASVKPRQVTEAANKTCFFLLCFIFFCISYFSPPLSTISLLSSDFSAWHKQPRQFVTMPTASFTRIKWKSSVLQSIDIQVNTDHRVFHIIKLQS